MGRLTFSPSTQKLLKMTSTTILSWFEEELPHSSLLNLQSGRKVVFDDENVPTIENRTPHLSWLKQKLLNLTSTTILTYSEKVTT
jgi:hypothetical protein